MYKTLAVAALVGSAASYTILDSNTYAWNWMNNGFSYYKCSVGLTADAGYRTLYQPSQPRSGTNMNNGNMAANQPMQGNSQTYAFNIFSYLRLTFNHEVAENYKTTYDFQLDVLDFTPYGQTVTWKRFDKGDGWEAQLHAYRSLDVANAWTRVREEAKTCWWSAFSMTMPTAPVCGYNADKVNDYMDPVWGYNAGTYFRDQMAANGNTMMTDISGFHAWY